MSNHNLFPGMFILKISKVLLNSLNSSKKFHFGIRQNEIILIKGKNQQVFLESSEDFEKVHF